jgi:Holliday junction resolvase|tara:strand:+ start:710 stop:1048 length:339 start_codon:yes stop_codon:yes gene_type:complete
MGRMSRSKGSRVEREFVNKLRDSGVYAERVPLSGAAGGQFSGDLVIPVKSGTLEALNPDIKELRAEVKARKDGAGFTQLEKWKGDNDLLFLKRDRQEPMVVMDWDLFLGLLT